MMASPAPGVSENLLLFASLSSVCFKIKNNLCQQRAIRVRSHSFETLGVPRKTSSSAAQRPKVKIHNECECV